MPSGASSISNHGSSAQNVATGSGHQNNLNGPGTQNNFYGGTAKNLGNIYCCPLLIRTVDPKDPQAIAERLRKEREGEHNHCPDFHPDPDLP